MTGTARRGLAVATSVVLAAFALSACGGSDNESSTTSGGSAGEGGAKKLSKPVTLVGFEGPAAQGGPDFMNGMRLAVAQLNAKGGIGGQQVNLKIVKTGGTPQGAGTAYRSAAQDSSVMGSFIGAAGALAIKTLSERAKLPAIAASGNNSVQTPVTKYMFSNSFGPEYATSEISYAMTNLDAKSFAILHYDTDFSSQIEAADKAKCEQAGCQITDVESASSTASVDQLTPQLTKMKASNPDAYYLEGLNPNAFKAARQLGMFNKPVLAENWLATPALVQACGANCVDVVASLHKCRITDLNQLDASDPLKPWCNDYIAAFKKQFPNLPFQLYSIYGHDAVMTYAAAIEKLLKAGKDVNRDNVVSEMENFKGDLFTSHGKVTSSPQNHRLTGTWTQGYVDQTFKVKGSDVTYILAPKADPKGATP
jgi:branched-chain amino acid transport system substrate-binding protein